MWHGQRVGQLGFGKKLSERLRRCPTGRSSTRSRHRAGSANRAGPEPRGGCRRPVGGLRWGPHLRDDAPGRFGPAIRPAPSPTWAASRPKASVHPMSSLASRADCPGFSGSGRTLSRGPHRLEAQPLGFGYERVVSVGCHLVGDDPDADPPLIGYVGAGGARVSWDLPEAPESGSPARVATGRRRLGRSCEVPSVDQDPDRGCIGVTGVLGAVGDLDLWIDRRDRRDAVSGRDRFGGDAVSPLRPSGARVTEPAMKRGSTIGSSITTIQSPRDSGSRSNPKKVKSSPRRPVTTGSRGVSSATSSPLTVHGARYTIVSG